MREQKNLIRRKRLYRLILAVTALAMSFSVAAQSEVITLPSSKLTAKEVFENIQRQTHYHVAVNLDQTNGLSAEIGRSPVTVQTVLDRLLDGSGMGYRVDGNFIIITASEQNDTSVEVVMTRNLNGTVTDETGRLLEGVRVEVVDVPGKQAVTFVNGRFTVEGIPVGRRIVKLTSADGTQVRYREVTVPTGSDADVSLVLNEQLLANHAAQQGPVLSPQAAKSTAYFVPNRTDHTIRAFSDEPKSEYSFVPGVDIHTRYLPKAALKVNLLYLATTSLNIGAEFALARQWTFDLTTGINTWDLNGDKGGIRHWLVQPEIRYWFCNRFERHFVGLHGIGGQYQIQNIDLAPFGNDLTGKRYDGYAIGAGISYGYHLPMGKRWAWEFTVGAGYIYLDYDKYNCGECDNKIGKRTKDYFGPTKAGVSLIYMIR
jgi:Secretin and TonB N terminus short domain./Protein of unknown function (DUF3575).